MSRVLHRTGAIPPIAVSGSGIYLHTEDGSRIIDASGGAAVAALGHGNRRIAEAIGRQAATMAYAHTGTFSNQPAEDLAELLLHDEPGGLTRAWFCSSGSEGNEAALKRARQHFLEIGQPQRGGRATTAPPSARRRQKSRLRSGTDGLRVRIQAKGQAQPRDRRNPSPRPTREPSTRKCRLSRAKTCYTPTA